MKQHVLVLTTLLAVPFLAGAQVQPSGWWRCTEGDAVYNFHPALTVDGGSVTVDSLTYAEDYTVMAVYQAADDSEEYGIWQLRFDDSTCRSLTTRSIRTASAVIQYEEQNRRGPVITTVQQSAPPREGGGSLLRCPLRVGAADSMGSRIKIAEVMYFDSKIGQQALRRAQSYLAVKYGVTLGPVDYVDGHGSAIWPYRQSRRYHHRLTAVGCDSTYGLRQLRSRSECDSSLLTLAIDTLPDGAYCVAGDDGGALSFGQDGDGEYLQRSWKMHVTHAGSDLSPLRVAVDATLLPGSADSLVLTAGERLYLPDSTVGSQVYYSGIALGEDTLLLRLGRGAALWQLAQGGAKSCRRQASALADGTGGDMESHVYPNPTTGHYRVTVSGARRVSIRIYNLLGTLMATHADGGKESYAFDGSLPTGNAYYVTVVTEEGSQTTKLVVK